VSIACPSCSAPMRRQAFDRKPMGALDLDLCFDCKAIWFDQFESAQLSPGAVIELFAEINAHDGQPQRPIGENMRCPACRARLLFTLVERSNRISYYRCPASHGRLTTFFQFLREKNFVRSLTVPEVAQLRVKIAQVRCSSCGASVDLVNGSCPYCHAPISIIDADAVKNTLAELRSAQPPPHIDTDQMLKAVVAATQPENASERLVDLVSHGIEFLLRP
jgi:Zn-finger nucleic acid-binding protein